MGCEVLEDVGGDTDDIQHELDEAGANADVDKELASLKESAIAELGLTVRDWVDGDDPYQLVSAALGGAPAATAVTDSMPGRWTGSIRTSFGASTRR